ncbi:MAG: AAA-like domain-containing protein [Puniceicoccales bacterium]|jgi:hypothetical protein|nr:AAA-like domain-containing protein [Puniceicoccales bacterium]
MLPPQERLQGAQLGRYVRDKLYWVLHAPRQTGKTTFLQTWMREINAGGEAVACYVTLERCQGLDLERAMPAACEAIREGALKAGFPAPGIPVSGAASMLSLSLTEWAVLVSPKPLVVLFDEVDVLAGESMISFLRQLRGGFSTRGIGRFPVSIALVGMRDLKDYITDAKGGVSPNPGSPFNIKEDSAVIGNFSRDSISRLFAQRTLETGQQITSEALDYVYSQSRGQPWIVNNLFKRVTLRILGETSSETVTLSHLLEAREQMVSARETHLDALAYRLEKPEVRTLIEKILVGDADMQMKRSRGFQLCVDLGLVTDDNAPPTVSNPIYREVLAREITAGPQAMIPERGSFRWKTTEGRLDMDQLLREFQNFWREHSEIWERTSDYTEAFPHLLLMAFLQRITNGGGRIDREYAAGRGRLDLCVEYEGSRYILEIKLLRDYQTLERVESQGLLQIRHYRETVAPDSPCYLVIFDRRSPEKKLPWEQRIYWKTVDSIHVLGC